MKPLARAVGRVLRGLGIAEDVARAEAVGAWGPVAARVLGPDAVGSRAVRIEGSTLTIAVPDAGWASEIRLRETELIAAISAAAPRSGITSLRTVPARMRDRPASRS